MSDENEPEKKPSPTPSFRPSFKDAGGESTPRPVRRRRELPREALGQDDASTSPAANQAVTEPSSDGTTQETETAGATKNGLFGFVNEQIWR